MTLQTFEVWNLYFHKSFILSQDVFTSRSEWENMENFSFSKDMLKNFFRDLEDRHFPWCTIFFQLCERIFYRTEKTWQGNAKEEKTARSIPTLNSVKNKRERSPYPVRNAINAVGITVLIVVLYAPWAPRNNKQWLSVQ